MDNESKMQGLIENVRGWAGAKGFDDVDAQFEVHVEEMGEIAAAQRRGNEVDLVDALGDHMVTLINTGFVAHYDVEVGVLGVARDYRLGGSLDDVLFELRVRHDTEGPFSVRTLFKLQVAHLGRVADALVIGDTTKFQAALTASFLNLNLLAHVHGQQLPDCLEAAWNVIKDRTGKMVNGSFVKSEDLLEVAPLAQ